MVHYLYFFQVFLLNSLIHAYTFPDTYLNKGVSQIVRRNSVKNDSVFVDVLKNITRVNGVLEDLILNYEKLQKIYKSQETLTELSSEDADEGYKYNKRPRASLIQTTKPTFYSTQMFFSEEEHPLLNNKKPEEEQSMEDNKNPEEEQSVKDNKNPQEEQSVEDYNKTQEDQSLEDNEKPQEEQSAEDNEKLQKEQSVGDNNKSQVMQIIIKDKNTTNVKNVNNKNKDKKKQSVVYENSSQNSETDDEQQAVTSNSNENFEEIPAKKVTNSKNIPNSKQIKIANNKNVKPVTIKIPTEHLEPLRSLPDAKKKPIFHEPFIDTNKTNEMTTQKTQPHTFKKTIIKTEEFSNKAIWDTISENKPVHLKTEREIIYSKRLGHDDALFDDNRTRKLQSQSEEKEDIKKKEGKEQSSASVENDKLILKEQFKTRILRKAYGDACLKLVIRKCYKACKEAGNKACNEIGCQKITKEGFKHHSKTGCIKEFETPANNLRKVGGGRELESKITDDFRDITKNGYLAAVCLPPQRFDKANHTTLTKISDETIELNILRDRYEKACRRSSRGKCLSACQYAIGKTFQSVKTHDADQRIAFEKFCKKECYSAYKGYHSKEESKLESSESSDSLSSESDSKSDSDSTDSDSSDCFSNKKKKLSKKTPSNETVALKKPKELKYSQKLTKPTKPKDKSKNPEAQTSELKKVKKKSKGTKDKKKTSKPTEDLGDSTDSSDSDESKQTQKLSKPKKSKHKSKNPEAKESEVIKVKQKSKGTKDKKKKPTEDLGDSTDSSDSDDTRML